MRRFQEPVTRRLFRGGDMLRLMSGVFMLVLLYMMINRARDASLWRWATNESEFPAELAEAPEIPQVPASSVPPPEKTPVPYQSGDKSDPPDPINTPSPIFPKELIGTDLDPDEMDEAQEEFKTLVDKANLTVDEMRAYWRFVRWSQKVPLETMRKRARRDVHLVHLIELPEKYRGQLIRLRLHLRQSFSWDAEEGNSAGVAKIYEAHGWADDALNFHYIVFTDRPAGMPIGPNVSDEVTFYGYFLKLMKYQDRQDKRRMAPLLIGRIVRHAAPPATPSNDSRWTLGVLIVGGSLMLLVIYRWTAAYAFPKPVKLNLETGDRPSLESWLQGSDEPPKSQPLPRSKEPTGS